MNEGNENEARIQDWIAGHGEPLPFSKASLLPDADLLDAALTRIERIRENEGDLSYQEIVDRVSKESGVPSAIAEVALYATLNR